MALKKVTAPLQIVLACIPLLFAIQQFAEGFVWLSLTNKNYEAAGPPATTVFLIFAQELWPVIVLLQCFLWKKITSEKNTGLPGCDRYSGWFLSWQLPVFL